LPPCGPYLATSKISPNNKVNARYNGQCSENELFATSGGQIWQINKIATRQRHQANEGKSGFEAEWIRALGALLSLQSKKMLAAEK
jgi:hypothetical protein